MPTPKGGGANAVFSGQRLETTIDDLICTKGFCLNTRKGKKVLSQKNPTSHRVYERQYEKIYPLPIKECAYKMIHDHYTEWIDRFGKKVCAPIELKEQKTEGSVSDKLDCYALRIRDGVLPFVILCINDGCGEFFKRQLTYYEGVGLRGFLLFYRSSMGRLFEMLERCRDERLTAQETLERLFTIRDNMTALLLTKNNEHFGDANVEIGLKMHFGLSDEQVRLVKQWRNGCDSQTYERRLRQMVGLPVIVKDIIAPPVVIVAQETVVAMVT